MAVKRAKTGIAGLDALVEGGFPVGSCILISGPPGTGKSITALHFLREGALNREVGVYISFDESRESILRCGEELGFNLSGLEKDNLLVILEYFTIESNLYLAERSRLADELSRVMKERDSKEKEMKSTQELENRIEMLKDRIEEVERAIRESRYKITQHEREEIFFSRLNELVPLIKGRRLVIDSLSAYMIYGINKEALHMFIHRLRDLGTTTLLISEAPEDAEGLEKTAEYLVDGVVQLRHLDSKEDALDMKIKKMRWTRQFRAPVSYEITTKGLRVKKA